jgi:Domain of unknown function (DUF4260)
MSERLPARLLRLEGLVVALGAMTLYFHADFGWVLLLLLILAPDLSMLGYLGGAKVGAATYDVVHTYALPVALGVVGVVFDAGPRPGSLSSGSPISASIASSGTGSNTRRASRTRTSRGSEPQSSRRRTIVRRPAARTGVKPAARNIGRYPVYASMFMWPSRTA